MSENTVHFFFHVPKTGGTTFKLLLPQWFAGTTNDRANPEELRSVQEISEGDLCVAGHFGGRVCGPPESLIRRYPEIVGSQYARVFTLLRDPVEQAISFYYHEKARNHTQLSLADFLFARHKFSYRLVFGQRRSEQVESIIASFFFLGVTEALQQSANLLADLMGKPRLDVRRENIGVRDHQAANITVAERARIERLYDWEHDLYQRVKDAVTNPSAARMTWDGGTQFRYTGFPPVRLLESPVRTSGFDNAPDFAVMESVAVHGRDGSPRSRFCLDEPIGITQTFELHREDVLIQPTVLVTHDNETVFSAAYTDPKHFDLPLGRGRFTTTAWIPPHLLNIGLFVISTSLSSPDPVRRFARAEEVLAFETVEPAIDLLGARGLWKTPFPGHVRPLLTWETMRR